MPKMRSHASPEKMGSRVIGQAASMPAGEVRRIGRARRAPASMSDFTRGSPLAFWASTNSMSRIALRVAMPAGPIIPIIAVAVK